MKREQAIQWCKDNNCDFITPVLPPPEDWMWCESDEGCYLIYIHIITDEFPIIVQADVLEG